MYIMKPTSINHIGYWLLILLITFVTGFQSINAEPDTTNTTQVVIATGVGLDPDKALKAAFRAAIEQVVGVVVDAETLTKNDDLVKDQILTYSDAYIEKSEKLKENKRDDGLFETRIKATVKREQLIAKLRTAQLIVVKVDGESLFAETVTKTTKGQDAAALLSEAFKDVPRGFIKAELSGKPAYDDNEKKLIVPVLVSINKQAYAAYAQKLVALCIKLGYTPHSLNDARSQQNSNWYGEGSFLFDSRTCFTNDYSILLCEYISDRLTSSRWYYISLTKQLFMACKATTPPADVFVEIIAKNGKVITTETVHLGERQGGLSITAPVQVVEYNQYCQLISLPLFGIGAPFDNGFGMRFDSLSTSKVVKVAFDLSPDEISIIDKIVFTQARDQ